MHSSVMKYEGDPDELLVRYEAMVREVPASSMRLHLCLRARDGIVVVDTCPTREAYETFASGPLPALRARHGLPAPVRIEDLPVHEAFVDGRSIV